MTAIEKMRKIVNWADWQNESFNDRFKTIKDLEKAYDYCNKKDIEFLDNIHSYDFEEEIRGADNHNSWSDYSTIEECEEVLNALNTNEVEISYRNRLKLNIDGAIL